MQIFDINLNISLRAEMSARGEKTAKYVISDLTFICGVAQGEALLRPVYKGIFTAFFCGIFSFEGCEVCL